MSHRVGTIQVVAPVVQIGPDFGGVQNPPNTWAHNFAPAPAPTGTRFVILHFRNVNFAANASLEVDLGYGNVLKSLQKRARQLGFQLIDLHPA